MAYKKRLRWFGAREQRKQLDRCGYVVDMSHDRMTNIRLTHYDLKTVLQALYNHGTKCEIREFILRKSYVSSATIFEYCKIVLQNLAIFWSLTTRHLS